MRRFFLGFLGVPFSWDGTWSTHRRLPNDRGGGFVCDGICGAVAYAAVVCCFRICFVLRLESCLVTWAIAGSGCLMTRVFIHLLFLSLLVCLGLNVHSGRMMLILDSVMFEGCLACFVLAIACC